MKRALFFILLIAAVLAPQQFYGQETTSDQTTVYYCIRHAEKDRSDADNKNPNLTEAGKQRAAKWAKVFENVAFDAIYSTDYNRTQQTALPTSLMQELEIQSYDPRNLYSADFAAATQGKTVLVVGHSNTTPMFVNAVLEKETYPWIADDNNGMLFIVTKSGEKVTIQVLQID